jgi:hypothetical protein
VAVVVAVQVVVAVAVLAVAMAVAVGREVLLAWRVTGSACNTLILRAVFAPLLLLSCVQREGVSFLSGRRHPVTLVFFCFNTLPCVI